MTNESPIHSATLQSMAEALAKRAAKQAEGTDAGYQEWMKAMGAIYTAEARIALRAFLQSADGIAIREALEFYARATTMDFVRDGQGSKAIGTLNRLTALEKECL